MTLSELFEALTTVGLFISVALVFLQLKRNGTATQLSNTVAFTSRVFELRNVCINKDNAEVITRGRKGLENLDDAELLMFGSYLLNTGLTANIITLGSQGNALVPHEKVRIQAINYLRGEWDNKGGRAYWDTIKDNPPLVPNVVSLITATLASQKL